MNGTTKPESWKEIIEARKIAHDALLKAGVIDPVESIDQINPDQSKIVMIVGSEIRDAIAAAVQAERESILKLADDLYLDYGAYSKLTESIRARNEANHVQS